MNPCKYKDIFGIPNQGVHKYRLFNIAIVDLIFTIILALIITKIFHYNFKYVIIFLIILSVFIHKLFCVNTTLTKLIF